MPDFNGNRLHFCGSGGDFDLYHAGTSVDGLRLVEDEVSDAVVDGFSLIVLNTLYSMAVMSYDDVGSCVNELMGVTSLPRRGLRDVFHAPVGTDDDIGRGFGSS